MSLKDREIAKTPFAVIDVETTGLSPEHDRVVELSIVALGPGEEPQVVFDSLIHPERPVAATEIHGITDADVGDAPPFASVAPSIVAALANRVVCSHSASFAVAFLRAELARCGRPILAPLPHVCTLLLPRALDATVPHLSLARACAQSGIDLSGQHSAVRDATAIARLLQEQLRALRRRGLRTFADLTRAAIGGYAFVESLASPLLPAPPAIQRPTMQRSRRGRPAPKRKANVAEYLEALLDASADLRIDDAELTELRALPARLGLLDAEVRAVHAKIFWGMLGRYVEDSRIDDIEADHLGRLRELLSHLGWAPGDAVMRAASGVPSA